MVWVTVPGTQPLVPVVFDYDDESDAGAPGRPAGYPIPPQAIDQARWIEGGYPGREDQGSDQHLLIVDRDHELLFETWQTRYNTDLDRWEAGSGAVFDLASNARRPEGWTSADAAGLAILPGLVRYEETAAGSPILHAFRFTVRDTRPAHVFPASHTACNSCPSQAPASGGRAPAAPSALAAVAPTNRRVRLTWRDNSSDETTFRVEMSRAGAPFSEIKALPANTTALLVTALTPNTRYSFRVRARNPAG